MKGPAPMPLDRIWARGVRQGDCLVWTGATVRRYGVIQRSGAILYVHRVAWELSHGEPLGSRVVLHRCDNPPCFEPEHLVAGTQAENQRDAAAKARLSWGEGRSNRKLSLSDVREIRRLYAGGLSSNKLAERYPVSARTIRKIVTGRNWRHDHGST